MLEFYVGERESVKDTAPVFETESVTQHHKSNYLTLT